VAETWDAIVIGSGIGGLTVSVPLGVHAGELVLVLERRYEADGFTHTFRMLAQQSENGSSKGRIELCRPSPKHF
jgi:choline dehydrogenase-like flavoprotein